MEHCDLQLNYIFQSQLLNEQRESDPLSTNVLEITNDDDLAVSKRKQLRRHHSVQEHVRLCKSGLVHELH